MFYPAMLCAANVHFQVDHEYVDLPMENTYELVVNDPRVIQPMTSLRYMLRADPYISIEYQERYIWNDQVPAGEWNETTCYSGDEPEANALEFDYRLRDRFLPLSLTELIPSLLRFYELREATHKRKTSVLLVQETIKCLRTYLFKSSSIYKATTVKCLFEHSK